MSQPRYASVDDYLQSISGEKAATIQRIINTILSAFPDLEVKIAWNVPQIHRGGKYVAGVDAFKNHITFSPWSSDVISEFGQRLSGYKNFKNCFQVPVDWNVDEKLIRDLVAARLAELIENDS